MTNTTLPAVLRDLAVVHRWHVHCSRGLSSPLAALSREPTPAPDPSYADADRPDVDWRMAEALRRALSALPPVPRSILCALARGCPPGTAESDCARVAILAAARDLGDVASVERRLCGDVDRATAREATAREALSRSRATTVVSSRARTPAIVSSALPGLRAAHDAATAALAAAVEARDLRGARLLHRACAAWLGRNDREPLTPGPK